MNKYNNVRQVKKKIKRLQAYNYRKPSTPIEKGERRVNSNGYILIRTDNGIELEHRVIMERLLGRRLNNNEVVHHINNDRIDNNPDNLQLLTKEEHDLITLDGFNPPPLHTK